ncbi:hypothetical protein FUT80_08340 [Treponema phagedenis]|nr:pyruvate kinase [Treponema phagedenis]QEK06724.1 hypothetical protein FUT80_08340 [Treponema phagedenis]
MKKTKVVCTIGPASESEETLRKMFKAGCNVCRLNFSHGSHEECNFTRGLAKFITRFGKKRVFLRVLGCFFVFFMTNFDGF